MTHEHRPPLDDPVGLFPLPNVVLFPGATLPLQVFEPRYRTMVRNALEGEGLIAMALLKPGYEGYYYTNLAEIAPVVCVGRIREHVQVPDGRYFINLQGLCRARVQSEDRDGEYRLARLEAIRTPHNPIAQGLDRDVRRAIHQALTSPLLGQLNNADKCRSLLQRSAPLEELFDFIAAALLPSDGVEIKQRLLEECDILQRGAILLTELQRIEQILERHQRATDEWPRLGSMN
jgi:Lon protease-like protein